MSLADSILNTPGKRIRALRDAKKLQRDAFCDRHGISKHSLRAWEFDLYHISPRSMDTLLAAFQKEGIICSPQWILMGEGPRPFQTGQEPATQGSTVTTDFQMHPQTVGEEAQTFLQLGSSRSIYIVPTTLPGTPFRTGDYVGGVAVDPEVYAQHWGEWCLIQETPDPKSLTLRVLTKYDAQLTLCAPIVWHRRGSL